MHPAADKMPLHFTVCRVSSGTPSLATDGVLFTSQQPCSQPAVNPAGKNPVTDATNLGNWAAILLTPDCTTKTTKNIVVICVTLWLSLQAIPQYPTVTYHKSPVTDHRVTTVQTYLIIMSPQYKHTWSSCHHSTSIPDHHVTTVQTYLIIMSPQYKHSEAIMLSMSDLIWSRADMVADPTDTLSSLAENVASCLYSKDETKC
jgi:hypothetical protein